MHFQIYNSKTKTLLSKPYEDVQQARERIDNLNEKLEYPQYAVIQIHGPIPVYRVYDRQDGVYIGGDYQCRKKATRRCNHLDTIYGACRYSVHKYQDGIRIY